MKKTLKKIGGFAIALVMATSILVPANASAQTVTIAELQALVIQLQAQLNALIGGGVVATSTYPRNLTIGLTGSDVVALQTFLETRGFLTIPVGVSKGYFGPLTRAAVSRYQAARGIFPTAGYFGPITRARIISETVVIVPPVTPPTTPPTTPGSGLSGGEGDLLVDVLLKSDARIDLGDTESVIEIELEAEDSDIQINRVDFTFDQRPWLYFDEVNLLVDGKEVDSLSGSGDFTETSGKYRARFSGINTIVEEGDTAEIALELVVRSSMAGSRASETVKISMTDKDIRFLDGAGLTSYAGDNFTTEVRFSDNFGEGTIKVMTNSDSPRAETIVLNENSRTSGIEVLVFDVQADNGDVEVTDITFFASTTGSTTAQTVYRARLLADGTVVSTKTFSGSATSTTFTDLDIMIDEDDTVEFSVEVDFNNGKDVAPNNFTVVSVTVDAEDSDFQTVSKDLTIGETHKLVVEGVVLSKNTSSTSVVLNTTTADASYGEFRIAYNVTAVGSTMWIPLTSARGANGTVGAAFQMEDSNGNAVVSDGTSTQSLSKKSGSGTVSGGFLRLNDGQTATVELYVTYNPDTAGQYRLQLLTTGFNDSSATTPNDTVNAVPTNDYQTGNLNIPS